jgi:hypothetical protein
VKAITYLPEVNKYRIEFGATISFPRELLDMFFPDAELIGRPYTQYEGAPVQIDGLVCTGEQWAVFTQFRRDVEEVGSAMYKAIDAQLDRFLVFDATVNPNGPCVIGYHAT